MAALDDGPVDMHHAVRDEVLGSIRAAAASSKGWMVAVLDKHATRVISTVVTMYDIMEERVTLVESLEKKRQPFPEMDVIYFVTPSVESVTKVVEDFKGQAMYRNVHIFFLSRVDAAAMAVLQANPKLVGRIKTFKEINVDFRVAEPFVFHLDMPPALAFRDLFVDSTTAFVQSLAAKLFTVCASLHECPLVRCRANSPMEMVGMKLVGMLAELKASGGWWHYGMPGHQERPGSVLLLLDRSEDLASPLLHACNYQSLVNDLLEVKDNVVTTDVNGKKTEVLLSQKDELWVKFKHQHIAEVIDGLTAYLSDFKARHKGVSALNNKGAAGKGTGDSSNSDAASQSVADLGAVVKAMPEYQAQLAMYSLHNSLASKCTKMLQAKDGALLNQINDVEQTLVTGFDQDGAPLKMQSVLDAMMDSLMAGDLSFKLRLTLLLVATQREKLKDADLDRACAMAGFAEEDKAVITNLQSLLGGGSSSSPQTPGGQVEAAGGNTKKKGLFFSPRSLFGPSPTSGAANKPEVFDYPSARFTPPLKPIVNELANDKLSTTDFPKVPGQENQSNAAAAPQSMRRAPGWAAKKSAFSGGRNFVFVAGGVTHAEMKAAADVSAATNKEVILGGTSILTPNEYLNALREI